MRNRAGRAAIRAGNDCRDPLPDHRLRAQRAVAAVPLVDELVLFAKTHGKQLEMKERLLSAYFVEGRNVGDLEELRPTPNGRRLGSGRAVGAARAEAVDAAR